MAKKAYIGVDNVARKVKKGYVGIDSVARKIKKAYIGVGGVARPCWSGGELAYYGTITPTTYEACGMGATSIGNHALFAGGMNGTTRYTETNAYDKNLTKTNPTSLTYKRSYIGASSNSNYAVFAGGYDGSSSGVKYTEAYNVSLTKQIATPLTHSRNGCDGTTIGNIVAICGGSSSSSAMVEGYDLSLTKSMTTSTGSTSVTNAATVGNYGVIGFYNGRVYSCNESLTVTQITSYSEFTRNITYRAVNCGNHVIMGAKNVAVVYDNSLTMTTITLNRSLYGDGATNVEGFAIFAGSGTTIVFDESLTQTTKDAVTTIRSEYIAATTIGNYGLFAGGKNSNTYYNIVDAYVVA